MRDALKTLYVQLLTEMRAETKGEHVFPGRTGERLVSINKVWDRIASAADLKGVRLHDLRHTYASILASAGLSLPIIGQLLGHTQPATTHRYSHLFDDPLRAATERVGALFQAMSSGSQGGQVVPLRNKTVDTGD
jgi:integrase